MTSLHSSSWWFFCLVSDVHYKVLINSGAAGDTDCCINLHRLSLLLALLLLLMMEGLFVPFYCCLFGIVYGFFWFCLFWMECSPSPVRDPAVLVHKDKVGFNVTKYSGHRQDYSEFSFSG